MPNINSYIESVLSLLKSSSENDCSRTDLDFIKKFLNNISLYFNINTKNKQGDTVASMAGAQNLSYKKIKMLLELGALAKDVIYGAVAAKNTLLWSELLEEYNNKDCIKASIKGIFDSEIAWQHKIRLINYLKMHYVVNVDDIIYVAACKDEREIIFKLLYNYPNKSQSIIDATCKIGNLDLLTSLLTNRNIHFENVFISAAYYGQQEIIQTLLTCIPNLTDLNRQKYYKAIVDGAIKGGNYKLAKGIIKESIVSRLFYNRYELLERSIKLLATLNWKKAVELIEEFIDSCSEAKNTSYSIYKGGIREDKVLLFAVKVAAAHGNIGFLKRLSPLVCRSSRINERTFLAHAFVAANSYTALHLVANKHILLEKKLKIDNQLIVDMDKFKFLKKHFDDHTSFAILQAYLISTSNQHQYLSHMQFFKSYDMFLKMCSRDSVITVDVNKGIYLAKLMAVAMHDHRDYTIFEKKYDMIQTEMQPPRKEEIKLLMLSLLFGMRLQAKHDNVVGLMLNTPRAIQNNIMAYTLPIMHKTNPFKQAQKFISFDLAKKSQTRQNWFNKLKNKFNHQLNHKSWITL